MSIPTAPHIINWFSLYHPFISIPFSAFLNLLPATILSQEIYTLLFTNGVT